jgi:preprotein translocase subunit YajC
MDNLSLYALVDPVFAQAPSGGGLQSLLFPVLLIAAMWFLLIAPQRKKQKAQQEMIKALTTGDEVLTAGGIYGAITNIKDDRLVVRIAEGTKVEISRAFVQAVTKKASESCSPCSRPVERSTRFPDLICDRPFRKNQKPPCPANTRGSSSSPHWC